MNRRRSLMGPVRWGVPDLQPAAVVSLQSPLGEMWVAASETAVVASSFAENTFIRELTEGGHEALVHGAPKDAHELALSARSQLEAYFAGDLTAFTFPIDFGKQTEFAETVLREVAEGLGFGETATYAEVGERSGRLRAARAVGNILATCPFTVIVPCHRVVHASKTGDERFPGETTQPSRKAWLLNFERNLVSRMSA